MLTKYFWNLRYRSSILAESLRPELFSSISFPINLTEEKVDQKRLAEEEFGEIYQEQEYQKISLEAK